MNTLILAAFLCLPMTTPGTQRFEHGLPADQSYFPIAVWLQSPEQAPKYKAAGFNLYVGLWQGPTEDQLATLTKAGMRVICEQNQVGLKHRDDPIIAGWMHGDEPDNAQAVRDPATGQQGWGPCIPPQKIVDEYEQIRKTDPSRPVMLNLGQGVANDQWVGRGSGAKLSDYETYVKGADIVSYDVYPVAGLGPDGAGKIWYVAKGLDRLHSWTASLPRPPRIWNCIECTRIDADAKATPSQVRSEVWMSLIHGSQGFIYFVHQFKPTFDEHALLDDPEMLAEVTAINRQIHELAPVLNSPTVADAATVQSSPADVPVDMMVKRHGGATYLFAVGMRNAPTTGRFALKVAPEAANVEVIGENRSLRHRNGRFEDSFKPYAVHLYRIGR